MKKTLTKVGIGIVTFCAVLVTPVSAFAATLSLVPANGTYNRGCTFQVKIDLDTQGAQTDGTDAVLLFDPSKITPSQFAINKGTIYPDYSNVVDAQNGKVTVSGIAAVSQAYSGQGTLGTVSFQVNNTAAFGPVTIKFDFDQNNKQKTSDSNVVERGTVAELLSEVVDGSYTIGSGSGCNGSSGVTTGGTTGGTGTTSQSGSGTFIPYVGAPGSSSSGVVTPYTVPAQQPSQLSNSGSFENSLILTGAGLIFMVLGVIGLAIL